MRGGLGAASPLLVAALLAAACAGAAAEPPPAPGTRLRLEKTLYIQTTPAGRVFAETRRLPPGVPLGRVLAEEYGIPAEGVEELVQAFRDVNPGVDPSRVAEGQVVRVPFKVERAAAAGDDEPAAVIHTVRRGESLWRIVQQRFKLGRDRMREALAAVARANPEIRNLDHVVPGQKVVLPGELAGPRPPPPGLPSSARGALDLLAGLGCRVSVRGETLLPLARGRSLRLDNGDFPIVAGPSGRTAVLDPHGRLSAALIRSVEQGWGYTVMQGAERGTEEILAKLLPRLGFFELSEGVRAATLEPGLELVAQTLWSVVPREADLWEGAVHLILPATPPVDGVAAALAVKAGYSVHVLGGRPAPPPDTAGPVPALPAGAPPRAEAALLGVLGVPHRLAADVECRLEGGVTYRVRSPLTFDHGGLSYALAPREPARAAALLERAGYVALSWPDGTPALTRLRDLLGLLGIPHTAATVEAPAGGGLRLRVRGLVLEQPRLAALLLPAVPPADRPAKVLLTEARVPPTALPLFLGAGLVPWVLAEAEAPRR